MFGRFAKYHFFKILKLTLAVTAVPAGVLWLTQASEIFEFLLTGAASSGLFLKLSLLTLPPVLSHILPAGFLAALMTIFIRGHSDHSFLSLWAAGGKPERMARPFLLVAVIVGLLTFVNSAFLAPQSSRALRQTLYSLESETVQAFLKPGIFLSPAANLSLFVRDTEDGGKITGFFLQDKSDPEETRTFTAREAVFTGEKNRFLTLIDGKIVTLPRSDNKKRSSLSFDKFTIDLTALRQKILADKPAFKAKDTSFQELLSPPATASAAQRAKFTVKAHEYITGVFHPVAYALIACLALFRPFPLRRGIGKQALYAIGAAIGLKFIFIAVQNLAVIKTEWIFLMYLLPLGVILQLYVRLRSESSDRSRAIMKMNRI